MNTFIYFAIIFIFISFVFILSFPLYKVYLRLYTKHLKKEKIPNAKIAYSFEQIVFFFTRPSLIPALQQATVDNIELNIDHEGYLNPKIKGIKVFLHHETVQDPIFLAYLGLENFRSPLLDRLLMDGKITGTQYSLICSDELLLPYTQNNLKEEVVKQLKVGRYL